MTFFESLLALLLIAIVLLQLARRLSLPYPTMLAGAGVIVAMIPKAPSFSIDPVDLPRPLYCAGCCRCRI